MIIKVVVGLVMKTANTFTRPGTIVKFPLNGLFYLRTSNDWVCLDKPELGYSADWNAEVEALPIGSVLTITIQ